MSFPHQRGKGSYIAMQQEKALKILSEHRQAIADKYGVKRLGVFPYGEGGSPDCECERGNCCGYHPQIGVAVEYQSDAQPSLFDLGGLLMHMKDILGCDVDLETIGLDGDSRYQQSKDYLQGIVYVE